MYRETHVYIHTWERCYATRASERGYCRFARGVRGCGACAREFFRVGMVCSGVYIHVLSLYVCIAVKKERERESRDKEHIVK